MSAVLRGPYVSVAHAAAELGVSVRTIQQWCEDKRLRTKPRRANGAPWKILRSEVDRVLREREGR